MHYENVVCIRIVRLYLDDKLDADFRKFSNDLSDPKNRFRKFRPSRYLNKASTAAKAAITALTAEIIVIAGIH
jgi:hypothetical protein